MSPSKYYKNQNTKNVEAALPTISFLQTVNLSNFELES